MTREKNVICSASEPNDRGTEGDEGQKDGLSLVAPNENKFSNRRKMTNKVPPLKGAGGCSFCLSLVACEAIQKQVTMSGLLRRSSSQ